MKEKVGILTTVPIEIVYAAELQPIDLNNLFMNHKNPRELVNQAEELGFPHNYCSWIKGTFQAARQYKIHKIITVKQGECSNAEKEAELLSRYGITCIPFSYPYARNEILLKKEIKSLMQYFNVKWEKVIKTKKKIDEIRKMLLKLDEDSYKKLNVSGYDNYMWLISSTDFNSDLENYKHDLDFFLKKNNKTRHDYHYKDRIKIGVIGIPPIVNDLHEVIESFGAVVVFNEMPRQFSMPHYEEGLIEQYRKFTYPYDISYRIEDIRANIVCRRLDGIIHYCQSFCPRQIDDIVFRKDLNIPYMSIESDRPGKLDERSVLRIEAFLERWK